MSSSEFDIIRRFFADKQVTREIQQQVGYQSGCSDVVLGIGDDAAVLSLTNGQSLVVTTDTLISGVHFPADTRPENIGYKSLAVNLSDLAAMGAKPAWFTLSLTLPEDDENWLEQFSRGLFDLAQQHHIHLVGGDTTRGPLSITIQAMGQVPVGQALTRSGAHVNDAVYVTGTIGDAGAGLRVRQHEISTARLISDTLINRLERPSPRVAEGVALRGMASAVIDVSDGLGADLGHILSASHVGADININDIPYSDAFLSLAQNDGWQKAVNGGDDYELCFTIPVDNEQEMKQKMDALGCRCTRIGIITTQVSDPSQRQGIRWLDREGNEVDWNAKGYDHFSQ